MNRIEIEIGGKKRTIRFGLYVIGKCIEGYDNDPAKFLVSLTSNSFQSIPLLIWYGSTYHIERSGGTVDYTLHDVYDWVEEKGLSHNDISEVVKRFIRSLYENVPVIKEVIDKQDEEVKKNLIGTLT